MPGLVASQSALVFLVLHDASHTWIGQVETIPIQLYNCHGETIPTQLYTFLEETIPT